MIESRRRGSMRLRTNGAWELRVNLGTDPVTRRRQTVSRSFRGTERDARDELRRLVARVQGTEITVAELLSMTVAELAALVADKPTHARVRDLLLDRQKPGVLRQGPDARRFDFGALERLLDGRKDHETARLLGISARTLYRVRRTGVTWEQADRFAVRAGLHPAVVWLDWDVGG